MLKKKLLAGALSFLLILPMNGCVSRVILSALVATLGSATSSLANLEGNPTLAAQIKTDTTAAVSAIDNWQSGTPAQDVIEALGIVIDDLNLIPGTGPFAPLIDLALATVQSILEIVTNNSPAPVTAHRAKVPHRTVSYTGKVPKNSGDFKKKWNSIVMANPQLAPAAIK
jgi:hypothetical protein